MLRVIIEVVPCGDESKKEVINEIEIYRIDSPKGKWMGGSYGDYEAKFYSYALDFPDDSPSSRPITVKKLRATTQLTEYLREWGAVELLRQILNKEQKDFLEKHPGIIQKGSRF